MRSSVPSRPPKRPIANSECPLPAAEANVAFRTFPTAAFANVRLAPIMLKKSSN
jgi:hypothetical protein